MAICPTCRKRYPDDVTVCDADGDALLPDQAFSGVDADLGAGQIVGEYKIEGKLGEGGFGAVYRAVHPLIGKAAAVKVLNRQYSANPQMVSRFISEARAVNQIRHRNIIDIFSFGSLEDGRQYYVMELLDGLTLDEYIKQHGRLSPSVAIPILRAIGRALDAAHANGIAHRDLKPENIFLSFDDDGKPEPKLLDFGIAKLMANDGANAPKTRTGTPMGTPYYMSPEQCRGKNVDHRTDIYSFGIMAHEMLTGRLPFEGDDLMDLLLKHTTGTPPPVSSICPDVPPVFDNAILRMLEKDPAARPQNLAEAVDGLQRAAQGVGIDLATSGSAMAVAPGISQSSNIALDKTAAAPSGTFLGQEADVVPSPGSRKWAVAFAGLLGASVIGLGGYAVVARGRTAATVVPPSEPSAPTVHATVQPSASGAATETPESPKTIEIALETEPAGVEVFVAGSRVGAGPMPVRIERVGRPVEVELRAEGYVTKRVTIDGSQSTTIRDRLEKVKVAKPKPTVIPKEVESPF